MVKGYVSYALETNFPFALSGDFDLGHVDLDHFHDISSFLSWLTLM